MAPGNSWASICLYFRASENLLRPLDRAEKRKMAAPSSFPGATVFPSTTTTRGEKQAVGDRGGENGEDLNSKNNYNRLY